MASNSTGSHDPADNTWQEYIKDTLLPNITCSAVSERDKMLHLLLVRIKRKGMFTTHMLSRTSSKGGLNAAHRSGRYSR